MEGENGVNEPKKPGIEADVKSLETNQAVSDSPELFAISEHKKIYDYQTIFDSVPAIVFYKNRQNYFVRTNKFFESLMALPKEKLEGKSLFEIFPKEQAETFWKEDLEVMNSGVPKNNIVHPINTPGGTRILSTDKIPYLDESGKIIGVIGFSVDITERIKTEEKYKNLVKYAATAIFEIDFNEKRFKNVNEGMCRIFGYSEAELLSMNPMDMLEEKSRNAFFERIKKAQSGEVFSDSIEEEEYEAKKKDGNSLWGVLHMTYRYNEGKISGAFVIAHDVTERKKMEQEILRNEIKYRELADSISDPFTAYDSELKCVFRNSASEINTNITNEQAIGKTFEELHPEMVGSEIHKAYLFALKSKETQIVQTEWTDSKTGETTYRELSFYPTKEGGISVISADITNRKKLEKKLSQLATFPELNPNPILELNLEGKIIYKNPNISNLFPDLSEKGAKHPFLDGWEFIKEELLEKNKKTITREVVANGRYYKKMIHYLPEQKKIRIYGTDITEQKKKEHDLQKLNRTLFAHLTSSKLLMTATDEVSYLNDICKIIVNDCGYAMVWIGYAQDDQEQSVKTIAHAGFEDGYLDDLKLTWADKERGRGPTGTAIRTGQVIACKNMLADPRFSPWREQAMKHGFNSSVAFPIKDNQKTFGAITIYSKEQDPFEEKEIELLKELSNDISYGINSLRIKKAHGQAEELLHKNEVKLQTEKNVLSTIMANTKAGLAYVDTKFNFVAVNSVYCKSNGRSEKELLGKNYFNFFPSEENLLLFEKVRDTGQAIELNQKPSVSKHQPWQEITYFDWTLTPVKNNEGFVYGLVISLVDVSERVKSIENLKLHGQELEEITSELEKVQVAVENASDIVFITDDKGKIIYINRAVKKILGHTQKELIGKKPSFWMDYMPNKFFSQMWQAVYFEKKPFIGELQERKKDGDIFTAEIRISPVLDKNGQILSFVGIERDITEIKRIDTAKTEFISLAAHQLRTPITTVSLTAEMLLDSLPEKADKEIKEHLGDIMNGIQKMSEMIELFLNVSRIEMKAFEIVPKPMDLGKIIEENIKDVMPQAKTKGIDLKKNISKDLPIIELDSKVMNIVLENLLSNSIKYTPNKGLISIEAEKYRDDVVIKITDTGCGIPKKMQAKVFDKLFRVESEAQKVEGVGLGLYLCKALIEQAGGKIWLSSELNSGSTFYVSIPLEGMKTTRRPRHNS